MHPRDHARRAHWQLRTDLGSRYESDESLSESDYQSYFTGYEIVELERKFVWDLKDELLVTFDPVTEADPRASAVIEASGSCSEVPADDRHDEEQSLSAVVDMHIDEHKMITSTKFKRALRDRMMTDELANPGELCCWTLMHRFVDGGPKTCQLLQWKLKPFQRELESFVVSSLFLVTTGTTGTSLEDNWRGTRFRTTHKKVGLDYISLCTMRVLRGSVGRHSSRAAGIF